jgi:hypothetical protein
MSTTQVATPKEPESPVHQYPKRVRKDPNPKKTELLRLMPPMNDFVASGFNIVVKYYRKIFPSKLFSAFSYGKSVRISRSLARLEPYDRGSTPQNLVSPRGGKVYVMVSKPEAPNVFYRGESHCSDDDNFDRKHGLYAALKAALEETPVGLSRIIEVVRMEAEERKAAQDKGGES